MLNVNLNNYKETVDFLERVGHKKDFDDFIDTLGIENNIFINDKQVIPFVYKKINNEYYFIYHGDEDKSIELMKTKLNGINYDISKLKVVPFDKIIDDIDFYKKPYFLINSKIMK